MTIGELIKTARKRQGLTQQDVANLSSINKHTIASIEIGRTSESRFYTIVCIARVLNIDPKDLFDLVPRPFVLEPY
jgi:transcriptional regulator with XRE-family HTH domain